MDVGGEVYFGVVDLDLSVVAGDFSNEPGGLIGGVALELVWLYKPHTVDGGVVV